MCGRVNVKTNMYQLGTEFGVYDAISDDWRPSYNVPPSQPIPVIYREDERLRLKPMRWGLVPIWADKVNHKYSTANARAETIATNRTYAGLLKANRCLVLIDGWYEWLDDGQGPKRPHYYHAKDGRPLSLAGLWYRNPKLEVDSCTIVVASSPDAWQHIHDRAPVVLSPDDHQTWLAGSVEDALSLLHPIDPSPFAVYEVSRYVNSPRNNTALCIEPVLG